MGGFPALQINQGESPLKQYAQAQQVLAGQQEIEQGALKLKDMRQSQAESQFIMELQRKNQGDIGQTIQDAQSSGKVRPQTVMALQKQQLEMHTALAAATEKDLGNAAKTGDLLAGALDTVMKAPEANRPEVLKNQIASLAAMGVPVQNIQKQLSGLQDLSDKTLQGLETSLIGHKNAVENELNTRKTQATEAEAAARTSQAATAAAKVGPEVAHLQAQTQLAQTQNAQAGQVTEKDKYVQGMENYRATLARQAEGQNQVQRKGLDSLQKQSETYTQFQSTATSLKNSLLAAGNGNEMAAAVAPLQGTLFITTSEGVKRINETELKGVSGAGSLVQRINGALSKTTGGGPLSQKLKDDMASLVDLYENAKYESYQKQAAYTQKLHGLDPATTPILDRDGSITTINDKKAAPAAGKPPAGATHIVQGPDGKNHYTNAAGTQDLGIAP